MDSRSRSNLKFKERYEFANSCAGSQLLKCKKTLPLEDRIYYKAQHITSVNDSFDSPFFFLFLIEIVHHEHQTHLSPID